MNSLPTTTVQIHHPTPLGLMSLAATDQGLAGAWFLRQQRHLPARMDWQQAPGHPVLQAAAWQLDQYFAGNLQVFDLPLDLGAGSAFQRQVWQALLTLSFGQCCSYQEIGQQLGRKQAARAVGSAVGRNPLSIIVPCHRVRGAKGQLTGYAGGLDRKTALLQLEGVLPKTKALI